jgi:hypothetical protein
MIGTNEDTNIGSSRRLSAVAAAKRVKVAPTHYAPVVEAELREAFPLDSSGVVISNTALTAAPRCPLYHSSATDETITNVSNAADTNTSASRRVSAIAAATLVYKRRKVHKTFDERFKDLMAFKAKFGHCNVLCTQSSDNKHSSLGMWCGHMRQSYKSIKEGGKQRNHKLSKADMKRLENAGFEWKLCKTFDDRFKDLMAFKAKFGHCNVPQTKSNNNKQHSLGMWCCHVRTSYKFIKEGGYSTYCKLSK